MHRGGQKTAKTPGLQIPLATSFTVSIGTDTPWNKEFHAWEGFSWENMLEDQKSLVAKKTC